MTRIRSLSKRDGVTLIEVVIALSLGAMLMLAISGILRSLLRQQQMLRKVGISEWAYRFDQLLWHDLAESQQIWSIESGMGLIKEDGARCEYRIVTNGDGRRLMRFFSTTPGRNTDDAKAINQSGPIEQTLIWGIDSIDFVRVDTMGQPQPLSREGSPSPACLRYVLRIGDELVERTVTVR